MASTRTLLARVNSITTKRFFFTARTPALRLSAKLIGPSRLWNFGVARGCGCGSGRTPPGGGGRPLGRRGRRGLEGAAVGLDRAGGRDWVLLRARLLDDTGLRRSRHFG